MKRIRPFIGREIIKVLTGIRRSGKSVMLSLIQEELRKQGVSDEQMISFNFEQLVNRTYCNALALHEEISRRARGKTGKLYFFFDEIQEVEDWQRCINSLRLDFDSDIYVTGSNAKLLSGELATYLAGRYVEFVMYPFSFAEFIAMQQERGAVPLRREGLSGLSADGRDAISFSSAKGRRSDFSISARRLSLGHSEGRHRAKCYP